MSEAVPILPSNSHRAYNKVMVPVIRKFSSFAEADAADVEADMQLSPEQRLQMVMELRERYYGAAVHQRLDLVYRIVKRGES